MTAPVIPAGLEPLAVRDVRDWHYTFSDGAIDQIIWRTQCHIAGHVRDPRRVEICLPDGPFARVYSFARDGDGCKYRDPATGWPAEREPVIVPLAELPPAHLPARP